MPSVELRVTGVDRVLAAFNRLSTSAKGGALADAAAVGAEVAATESKRIVPVDTGNLRASITTEETLRSPTAAAVAVGYGAQAPYGKYVELGTSRMSAQPFLRPPLVTHKAEIVRAMTDAFQRAIDRAAP